MFTKGKSGNPNGRPKGSQNRATSDLRQAVKKIVDEMRDDIPGWLAKLEPAQRIDVFVKLLQFCLPNMQSISISSDIDLLSPEEVESEINALEREVNSEKA